MAEPNKDLQGTPPVYSFQYGGIMFNYYSGNKGQGLPKHEHTFSHLTVVTAGKTCLRKENVYRELLPGEPPLSLKENEWHEIEILEDNTVFININMVNGGQDA